MKSRVLFTVCALLTFTIGICEKDNSIYQQPSIVAEIGINVTLPCVHADEFMHSISWYKQSTGKKPLLIAYSARSTQSVTYQNGFDSTNRHFISTGETSFNLSIVQLEKNDFETYYCAVSSLNVMKFGEGTILLRKETMGMRRAVVQQPVSDRRPAGDSVTLQCSVVSQICAGEYSVYWFRHSAGSSPPGIIYSHENRSGQCEERSEDGSSTQSCVYSLSQTPLTAADAGLYYCAVATCGMILFGNGTKLIIDDLPFWNPVTLVLATLSTMAIIIILILLVMIQKISIKEALNHPINHWKQIVDCDTLDQEETRVVYTQLIMH